MADRLTVGVAARLSRYLQVLTQAKAWVYYLKVLCLPHPLNVEHQFSLARGLADPPVLAALLVLVSLLAMGWLIIQLKNWVGVRH